MGSTRYAVLLILIAAEGAIAQMEERPRIAIPEPQHKARSQTLTLTVVDYAISDDNRDRFPAAIPELIQFLRRKSAGPLKKTEIGWNKLSLDDSRIMQSRLLYMTGWDAILQISEAERRNLGHCLKAGGLLYADDIRQSRSSPSSGRRRSSWRKEPRRRKRAGSWASARTRTTGGAKSTAD